MSIELAIEYRKQVRFGQRLKILECVDPTCLEHRVPLLILQPLVENALKHGISELVEGGTVEIGARCDSGNLVLWVENPVDPDLKQERHSGVGLTNVQRRLDREYGSEGVMRFRRDEASVRVEIVIPPIPVEEEDDQDERQ